VPLTSKFPLIVTSLKVTSSDVPTACPILIEPDENVTPVPPLKYDSTSESAY